MRGKQSRPRAYLVVKVVEVPGENASDAVHLLRQEGAAVGARVHTERENADSSASRVMSTLSNMTLNFGN